jgi:hypothetical protein
MKSRNDKSNFSMTTCTKTGIRIKNSGNDYKADPFANVNPFANQVREVERVDVNYDKTQYESIDLNIENYSREELYKLFGFRTSVILTEENMKYAKKVVLKTHPDKSRLDNKYFVFFSKAYKKLQEIYEFQNKTNSKKSADTNEYYDGQNSQVLDKMFDIKKDLKDSNNFNKWFNEQFEKHRIDDPVEHGYGNWLKSEEDIVYTPQNVNKDTMGREMEKRKKEIQSLTPYTGVSSSVSNSSVGGSSLMEYNSNFTSNSLFSGGGLGYTDLRQAYVESVIPVTEEDFNKTQKFKNVEEYKRHRDNVNIIPLSKEEAMRQLFHQEKKENEESAALAFYYAQQSEKAKKNNETFWSGLKQLTNW